MTLDLNLTNIQVEDALSRSLNTAKSVLDYGVDNTGSTDCTSDFAAAIADNAGKTLRVPAGTYLLSEGATAGTCLSIIQSIALIMDPDAVLKLDVGAAVPLIMIGDNSTAFSKVSVIGGALDGDAANSTISPIVRTSLLEVRGPVADVLVADVQIGNAKLGGLEVSGTDTDNRAERVFIERCPVTNVTEGIVIQNANEVHTRGCHISGMTAQDCFEPHGNISGWSLRDCTIEAADPTNSEIEIYPQVGDILHGVIENVRIKGEMRISVSSPDAYKVQDLTVRSCVFEHGLIYAGVGTGHYYRVVVNDCEFIGPASNVPRSVPNVGGYKSAIHAGDANNRMDVFNCRVHDYEATGIIVSCDRAQIGGNTIYNNGQAGASLTAYLRSGIRAEGDHVLVSGNQVYDNQTTVTQIYTPQITGAYAQIVGNKFTDATTLTRNLGTGWVSSGNVGDIQDVVDALVTMPAGQYWVNVDQTLFPMLEHSGPMKFSNRVQVTPVSDITPASYWRPYVGAGNWQIRTDVAPTYDVTFHVQAIVMSEQVDATA